MDMKVRFEGGPLDGQFRELPEGTGHFYAQRLTDPLQWVSHPNVMIQAETIEYRPAYVVFAEVPRGR